MARSRPGAYVAHDQRRREPFGLFGHRRMVYLLLDKSESHVADLLGRPLRRRRGCPDIIPDCLSRGRARVAPRCGRRAASDKSLKLHAQTGRLQGYNDVIADQLPSITPLGVTCV